MMTPETDIFYFIFPDETGRRVLLSYADEGWTLPFCEVRGEIDLMDTVFFNRSAAEHFRLDVTTLYALDTAGGDDVIKVAAFENHAPGWQPADGTRWIERKALKELTFTRPIVRSVLEAWFAEADASPLIPWSKLGWFDEAAEWTLNQLRRLGIIVNSPVEQVKSFYTGGTLRVNTDGGYVYFKAVTRAFIRELEIMQVLSELALERVPALLAIDQERRWMLLKDMGGADLKEISEIAVWEDALRAYAQLQIASLAFIDDMPNTPFYDYRLNTMVSAIDPVIENTPVLLGGYHEPLRESELKDLRSVSPRLKALCAEMESYGVPCALEHGDFHAGNVRITENGVVFYDWAWSYVTHPFLGVSGLLHKAARELPVVASARSQLRDVYLKEWLAFEPLDRLRELFDLIERWKVMHAVITDAEWVAAYQEELAHCEPLRHSFTEWSLRKRQYYLARVMRRLVEQNL